MIVCTEKEELFRKGKKCMIIVKEDYRREVVSVYAVYSNVLGIRNICAFSGVSRA